jgi:hypothetical protein
MSDCHSRYVLAARLRVVNELAQFRVDNSDERLASLKAAIDSWHDEVGAWSKANMSEPSKQKLS